jgi:hypothetical protein
MKINGLGLHHNGLKAEIRIGARANADSATHFSKICESWANRHDRAHGGNGTGVRWIRLHADASAADSGRRHALGTVLVRTGDCD